MRILFIIDPIASLKAYKDSSVAMMFALQARGHELFITEQGAVFAHQGVQAEVQAIRVVPGADLHSDQWWQIAPQNALHTLATQAGVAPATGGILTVPLAAFDAVLMRKDPPFDMEYAYSCHLLAQAEREGAKVFNKGLAMLNHPEKLSIAEFADFTVPTLVTRDMQRLRTFYAEQQDIIVKPLDGMGGMGVFRLRPQEVNVGAILESLTQNGTQTIMAQRYIPEITQGDKRVLIINGEIIPYCLARIPLAGETRGNLAAGGRGVAQALSEQDWRIARAVAPVVKARGLFLVGLDIIGDYLTELNVTSPTCFVEISEQSPVNVGERFALALEQAVGQA